MRTLMKGLFAAVAGVALMLGAGGAAADTVTYNLVAGNTPSLGAGPFGTVTITTNGTGVATVLFTANTAGGYAFVDGGAAALNVNGGALTAGSLSGTLSPLNSGGSVGLADGGSGQVDGWGNFSLTVNNNGAWSDALATISFTVTKTTGNWGSADSVLVNNAKGFNVAAHVGYCAGITTCTGTTPATATGYVAAVPLPAAAWLFGSGLVGLIAIARRRIKGSNAAAAA